MRSTLPIASLLLTATFTTALAEEPPYPVTPEVFIDQFRASEGITFNAQGQLFIGANNSIWRAEPDGSVEKITDVYRHLGMAGIGERDVLAADFGPTNVFRHRPNDDGLVWRVTPEGEKTVVARGMADPNAIAVRPDGSFLVSDDGTNKIFLVDTAGNVRLWSQAIGFPNGIALSLDGNTLYAAQIFKQMVPILPDDRIWGLPLAGGEPAGPARLVGATGRGAVDGIALDVHGRIYVADNGGNQIARLDPETGEVVTIAEGMPAAASLVFGEGEFDNEALYVTSTFRGGGTIWKVPVGVRGAPLHR